MTSAEFSDGLGILNPGPIHIENLLMFSGGVRSSVRLDRAAARGARATDELSVQHHAKKAECHTPSVAL